MQELQSAIADELQVRPPFTGPSDIDAEIQRRIAFIQQCLRDAGLKTLVLGISGGVDSLTAGLLAQRAIERLRAARAGRGRAPRVGPAPPERSPASPGPGPPRLRDQR